MAHTILVVEDDAFVSEALCANLMAADYEVITATNGTDGLDAATSKHPDLILLDYRMPKMTGLQMLERLRENYWGKTARVIFLTNEADLEAVNGAIRYGVHDYVVKSEMTTAALLKLIAEKLKNA